MATWSNLSLQDGASPLMEQLSFFHDHTMVVLLLITVIVDYALSYMLFIAYTNRNMLHGHLIETIWTALPAITLIFIALPSLRLLYLLDDSVDAMITIKTIGRQWYWSYEYSDFMDVEFDTYMTPEQDLENDGFRLLDVDNRTILPMNTEVRVLTSASDVLHSWAVPAETQKLHREWMQLSQSALSSMGVMSGTVYALIVPKKTSSSFRCTSGDNLYSVDYQSVDETQKLHSDSMQQSPCAPSSMGVMSQTVYALIVRWKTSSSFQCTSLGILLTVVYQNVVETLKLHRDLMQQSPCALSSMGVMSQTVYALIVPWKTSSSFDSHLEAFCNLWFFKVLMKHSNCIGIEYNSHHGHFPPWE